MSICSEHGEAVIRELKRCASRIANLIMKLHNSPLKPLRQEVEDAVYRHKASQRLAEKERQRNQNLGPDL